jgi:hypothetical protein
VDTWYSIFGERGSLLKIEEQSYMMMPLFAGEVHIETCSGTWNKTSFIAGQVVKMNVVMRDAYGNEVKPLPGRNNFREFKVVRYDNPLNKTYELTSTAPINLSQREVVSFIPTKAGRFLYHVESADRRQIKSTPLNITVLPGTLLDMNQNS